MINWNVRIKNRYFWLTMIPAVLLLIQQVAAVLGFALDLGDLGDRIIAVTETVFLILGIAGIVNDPTTPGAQDSERAMKYTAPGEMKDKEDL